MTEAITLASAKIEGLFGEFTHELSFSNGDKFIILFGINGVGKTTFLEAIHAAITQNFYKLATIDFANLYLTFSDSTHLTVTRTVDESETPDCCDPLLKVIVSTPGKDTTELKPIDPEIFREIRENSPYVPYIGDYWIDERDGEVITFDELAKELRKRISRRLRTDDTTEKRFTELSDSIKSVLIDTHRIRVEGQKSAEDARRPPWMRRRGRFSLPRISEQSRYVVELLNGVQTRYSRESQQLDRTFPKRLLDAVERQDEPNYELVRAAYKDQNNLRTRLARVVSVPLSDDLTLPDHISEKWKLNFLDLYIEDAKTKMDPYAPLLERIELFEEIINSRLWNKRIQANANSGLSVFKTGTNEEIPLESLSSGEQHEIILMFDLLMKVDSNTLVLIDEPEISLHVVWQERFIPDVLRIAELVGFNFVVATHSPQVIGSFFDHAISLDGNILSESPAQSESGVDAAVQ